MPKKKAAKKKDDGRKAFARPVGELSNHPYSSWDQEGLTRREYAAIHIAAGLAAGNDEREERRYIPLPQHAVVLADELLKALDRSADDEVGEI